MSDSDRLFLGIDPGLTGFVAMVDGAGKFRGAWAIPTLGGSGAKRTYDVKGMSELLHERLYEQPTLVALERQQVNPSKGSGGNYMTGRGYGLVEGMLAAEALPYEVVTPKHWKKAQGVIPPPGGEPKKRRAEGKRLAIERAQQLFPGVDLRPTERSRKPSPDKAEALLLADYARKAWGGV